MTPEPTNRQLYLAACRIARHLTNQERENSYGRYQIYDDGRMEITATAGTGFIGVRLRMDGEMVQVYNASEYSADEPHRYRRGEWVKHLMELDPQAVEAERKAAEQRREQEEREADERRRPVEDSALFAEPPPKAPGGGESNGGVRKTWLQRLTGR